VDAEFLGLFREKVRRMERELGWSQKNDIQYCGVTMAQCHALLEIGCRDEVSIVELAAALGADTSTLSRTIDTMVRAGFVNRFSNPQDRRYVSLTLTEQGRAVFDTIDDSFNAYVERVFEFIPPEKHAQVMESLFLLTSALEQCGKTGSAGNDRADNGKKE
jgi:DNA-binding MarR family transcriptional regulator